MNEDIQKLKDIFLSNDVDSDEYADNLKDILEVERNIVENENLLAWQDHDLTKQIVKMARKGYIDISTKLAIDRKLTDGERLSLFAKQDAMKWIMGIGEGDPKAVLEKIGSDIKKALRNS